MRKMRYLTAALCAVVLLCSFTLPAYASGEAWESVEEAVKQPVQTTEPTPDPTPAPTVKPTPEPTPTPAPQPSIAPSGTGTVTNKPVVSAPVTNSDKNTGSTATGTKPSVSDKDDKQDKAEPSENETTGGADWEGLTPVNPLTPDGQGTMVDNATGEEGKEFFTITTADESVFYLVVDKQKGSQNVYFLNTVTLDDLKSLADPGKVEETPIVTPEPEPTPAPTVEPEPDPEPEQKGSSMGTLLLVLAVVVVGGGAGWYFKIYRPKQQIASELEEDDYPAELEPEFEDGYDDTPPWDEDDGTKEDE